MAPAQRDLETALLDDVERFMLALGKGFTSPDARSPSGSVAQEFIDYSTDVASRKRWLACDAPNSRSPSTPRAEPASLTDNAEHAREPRISPSRHPRTRLRAVTGANGAVRRDWLGVTRQGMPPSSSPNRLIPRAVCSAASTSIGPRGRYVPSLAVVSAAKSTSARARRRADRSSAALT